MSQTNNWQPIETAPKLQGKAVLLYVPENKCVFAAYWDEVDEFKKNAGWKIFGGDWREYLQRPSHWMPIPQRPDEIESAL